MTSNEPRAKVSRSRALKPWPKTVFHLARSFSNPLLLIGLLLLQGCVVIPTTEGKLLWGRRLSEEQMASLRLGMTRADVATQLGEPDVIWENQKVHAYAWDVRSAVVIAASGLGGAMFATYEDIAKHYVFLAQFDQTDRLARYARTVRKFHSFGAHVTDWVARSGGFSLSPESTPLQADESDLPSHKQKAPDIGDETAVLIQITGEINGKHFVPFAEGLTPEAELGLALADFKSGCLFRYIGAPNPLSRRAAQNGWGCLRLPPGTYYLGLQTTRRVSGPDREWRFAQPERLRFDVPAGAKTIYIGSIHVRCVGVQYSRQKPLADRFEPDGLSVRDETESARTVASAEKLQPPSTFLMQKVTSPTFHYVTPK